MFLRNVCWLNLYSLFGNQSLMNFNHLLPQIRFMRTMSQILKYNITHHTHLIKSTILRSWFTTECTGLSYFNATLRPSDNRRFQGSINYNWNIMWLYRTAVKVISKTVKLTAFFINHFKSLLWGAGDLLFVFTGRYTTRLLSFSGSKRNVKLCEWFTVKSSASGTNQLRKCLRN